MPTPCPVNGATPTKSKPVEPATGGQGLIVPDDILQQLSIEEKIQLLSGDDMWHTVSIPRLGVPRVRVSTVQCSIPRRWHKLTCSDVGWPEWSARDRL
jgi:hypothetical protein